MVTARKLRPYFLSHKVIVRTNEPLKQILGKPDLSGRLVKWAIELSEYDVDFEPRVAIKAQALADFLQETTRGEEEEYQWWKAYVDGSVTKEGAGVGIFIQDPENHVYKFAVKLNYHVSNNEAEYEALVRYLDLLQTMGATHAVVHSDSQLVTHQVLGTCEKCEERMVAYTKIVDELMGHFVKSEAVQIPREENTEADKLARIASSVEGTWADEIVLCNADAKWIRAEI